MKGIKHALLKRRRGRKATLCSFSKQMTSALLRERPQSDGTNSRSKYEKLLASGGAKDDICGTLVRTFFHKGQCLEKSYYKRVDSMTVSRFRGCGFESGLCIFLACLRGFSVELPVKKIRPWGFVIYLLILSIWWLKVDF